jgi:hypothetical protein
MQEIAVTHAQANVLAELSATKLLRGEFDNALRLASHGTRFDLALPSDIVKPHRPVPRLPLLFRLQVGVLLSVAMTTG